MKHLTDEQISALVDDALPDSERATCDAHAAGCEPCRARLAEYAALEQSLGATLTHDAGEAYFADFAERVQARIAAGAAAAPVRAAGRSWWAWFMTPRGLSFAGGTAALVITAGLAWMRFGPSDDVAGALRAERGTLVGESVRERAMPGDVPTPSDRAVPDHTSSADRDGTGEQPGDSKRAIAPGSAEAPPSAPRHAQAGGPGERERLKSSSENMASEQGTTLEQEQIAAPAPPTSPAALAPPPSGASAMAKDELQSRGIGADAPAPEVAGTRCGTVRDGAGRPVVGAQVTWVGERMSSVRTAADGSFCLAASNPGDTLSVLRVGYAPYRMVLTPTSSLAIALEPIGTLGSRSSLAFGGKPASKLGAPPALSLSDAAPAPDVFALESATVRTAVAEVREAAVLARRDRSASGYERAADRWQAIAAGLSGASAWEAAFQSLSALREAHRLEPSTTLAARLRAAMAAFVAAVPRSLPERATVLRWQAEPSSPTPR